MSSNPEQWRLQMWCYVSPSRFGWAVTHLIRILKASDVILSKELAFFYVFFNHSRNKFWEELIAYFPWYDTDRIENDVS
jgi:hypothetical protein